MQLNVELIGKDVNQIGDLDFLLIGHKNPLRSQIIRETNSIFKIKQHESQLSPYQYELLEAPSYKWKRVAAIKFRSNGKVSEAQFARISSALSVAIRLFKAESIGILPPTWRNPKYCALGVIYSIWLIGYTASFKGRYSFIDLDIIREIFPNPSKATFKIISHTGVEYFEEVLKDDCKILWSFIKQLCEKKKDEPFFPSYRQLRKCSVKFDATKIM